MICRGRPLWPGWGKLACALQRVTCLVLQSKWVKDVVYNDSIHVWQVLRLILYCSRRKTCVRARGGGVCVEDFFAALHDHRKAFTQDMLEA
jgi:hypothetical protein